MIYPSHHPSRLEEIGQKMIATMFDECRSVHLTDALYIVDYIGQRLIHFAKSGGWIKVSEKEQAALSQILAARASAPAFFLQAPTRSS